MAKAVDDKNSIGSRGLQDALKVIVCSLEEVEWKGWAVQWAKRTIVAMKAHYGRFSMDKKRIESRIVG